MTQTLIKSFDDMLRIFAFDTKSKKFINVKDGTLYGFQKVTIGYSGGQDFTMHNLELKNVIIDFDQDAFKISSGRFDIFLKEIKFLRNSGSKISIQTSKGMLELLFEL